MRQHQITLMNGPLIARRALLGAVGAVAALLVVIAGLAVAVDSGHLHGPLIRFVTARAGRPVKFEGVVQAHILSFHPQLVAERVTIGNPPWVPAGTAAEIGKITLVLEMPWFGRSFAIEKLALEGAALHLVRDSAGHANWQWTAKGGDQLPLIRGLSMPGAHVDLDDALRHLRFQGTVSAHEAKGTQAVRLLQIEGEGLLNGRPATFAINGDPLATASHAKPYRFTFAERSSGSRLSGRGFLSQPFNFKVLDTTFDAAGADLKDLYFLTGVTLLNTGAYRLSGRLVRRGTHTMFSGLVITFGQSDVRGTVSIETSSGRPVLDADLKSQLLRLADIGARAAGRESEAAMSVPRLLSDASFKPATARRSDGVVNFHARRVEVGRVPLRAVAARLTMDHGTLVAMPVSGDIYEGKFTAHVKIDATTDDPKANLDLKITNLQLGEWVRKNTDPPSAEGLLRARVVIAGRGTSVHQVAASANGTVTAVLSQGTLRDSLAELSGIDLRGLGLALEKSARQTAVRCAVASFLAHDGTLAAQSLVVDTDSVLITGRGNIELDSEAIDLELHGRPKGLRLFRLRSPLLVLGTLSHPTAGIQARTTVVQAAAAVALGVLLTPLASVLAFVDPGLTKDADCGALLAEAKALDTQAPAPAPAPAPGR
jgi:AsmA family protein